MPLGLAVLTRSQAQITMAIVSKVAAGQDGSGAGHLRAGIEDNLRGLRVAQLAAVNLRVPGDGRVDARFDDQLAAMVAARATPY